MRARAESRADCRGPSATPTRDSPASPTERAVSALSAPRRPPPRHIEPTTHARPRQHHSTTCRGVAVRARITLTIDQCSPPRQRVSGPTKIASCVLVAVAAVAPRCCSRPSCLPAKCRCDGWVIPTPPPRPQQETYASVAMLLLQPMGSARRQTPQRRRRGRPRPLMTAGPRSRRFHGKPNGPSRSPRPRSRRWNPLCRRLERSREARATRQLEATPPSATASVRMHRRFAAAASPSHAGSRGRSRGGSRGGSHGAIGGSPGRSCALQRRHGGERTWRRPAARGPCALRRG